MYAWEIVISYKKLIYCGQLDFCAIFGVQFFFFFLRKSVNCLFTNKIDNKMRHFYLQKSLNIILNKKQT